MNQRSRGKMMMMINKERNKKKEERENVFRAGKTKGGGGR